MRRAELSIQVEAVTPIEINEIQVCICLKKNIDISVSRKSSEEGKQSINTPIFVGNLRQSGLMNCQGPWRE